MFKNVNFFYYQRVIYISGFTINKFCNKGAKLLFIKCYNIKGVMVPLKH